MCASDWTRDPRVHRAIHDDLVSRAVIDAVHDAMAAHGVTMDDLARHLGRSPDELRALLSDPLGRPGRELVGVLTPLGLTLSPVARA